MYTLARRTDWPVVILLAFMVARWFIYWEAFFTVPVGNYLISAFDLGATLLVAGIALARGRVKREFAICSIGIAIVAAVTELGALLAGSPPRPLDFLVGLWYMLLPFLAVSVIPQDSGPIVLRLVALVLLWFNVQQFLGAVGLTALLFRSFNVTSLLHYDTYAGLWRPNNTLGGATGGAHVAFLLLATYLLLARRSGKPNDLLVAATGTALILSFSRSVWLETVLLGAPWAASRIFRVWLRTRQGALRLMIVGCLTVGLILALGLPTAIWERLFEASTATSDQIRTERLQESIEQFTRSASVWFGTGLGTSHLRSWIPVNTQPYFAPEGWTPSDIKVDAYYLGAPHNTYVVLLNEVGLLGVVALLPLVVATIGIPLWRSGLVGRAALLATAIGVLNTETVLLQPEYGFAFGLMVWAGVASQRERPLVCSKASRQTRSSNIDVSVVSV